MNISTTLLDWYQQNKRLLPWRDTQNAYHIWVSEIILQQTRVAQGLDYYTQFLRTFPTVQALAAASETEVLRQWQGLGYYSRARNMHKAAKQVVAEHGGIFPTQYNSLLQLPGIGAYTAAAIASFATNAPYAVVDGNVYRVLSRLFGIDTPIDSTAGKKLFAALAQDQLDKHQPALYNQAMMDFGAIQCLPQNPHCTTCPLAEQCEANRQHLTHLLPVKTQKVAQRKRHFWYLDIRHNGHMYWQQRTQKDIWQGLYEPYLIEAPLTEATLLQHPTIKLLNGTITHISTAYKHVLSHQIIEAKFVQIRVEHPPTALPSLQKISDTEVSHYPVSRLVEKYLQNQ